MLKCKDLSRVILKIQFILHSKHTALVIKTNLLLLCREIITVYS